MIRYREEIVFFSRTFYFILAVLIIAGVWLFITGTSSAGWAVGVSLVFPLLFGRMVITVTDNRLHINFGYLNLIKKEIPLSAIRETRVVEYRPIRQFGGWGIRFGRFEGETTACYTLKGKRGLLLLLTYKIRAFLVKTDRVIIGSNDPEKLKTFLSDQTVERS
jgi:hypothetical protein